MHEQISMYADQDCRLRFLNRGSAIRLGKIVTGRFGPAGYLGAGREAII